MRSIKLQAVILFAAIVGMAALPAASAQADTIDICKQTIPSGGGPFLFDWFNTHGFQGSFSLNDRDCHTVPLTPGVDDMFNGFTEHVPLGWTLTNITCTYTTSVVNIIGANPNPTFEPGDETVTIDQNEASVTCTFENTKCPLTQGFWANHPELWSGITVALGIQSYDQKELLNILRTAVRGDASLILARQLIAAKLNIANDADSSPVASTLADADKLLSGNGKLPYGVRSSSATGQAMTSDAQELDDYNNGLLTPECAG